MLPWALSVGLRAADHADWKPHLRNYIKANAPPGLAAGFETDIAAFNDQRRAAVTVDVNADGIAQIAAFLAQLDAVESRIPLNELLRHLPLRWYSALGRKPVPFVGYSLDVERASLLFNIGALSSLLASAENPETPEGIKRACSLFQQAAGVFSVLEQRVAAEYRELPAPDFGALTLRALGQAMLAQAQDCFVRKAVLDRAKPALLAKLAFGAHEMFAAAQLAAVQSTCFTVGTTNNLQAWASTLRAIAHLNLARDQCAAAQYGNELFHLEAAGRVLETAGRDREARKTWLVSLADRFAATETEVAQDLVRARRDNDQIYHETVPRSPEQAAPLERALVVKATPLALPALDPSKLLFSKLPPARFCTALQRLDVRRDELVTGATRDAQRATAALDALLARLGLPGALTALEAPSGVPAVVAQQAAQIRAAGGAVALRGMLENLLASEKTTASALARIDALLRDDVQLNAAFQNHANLNGYWSAAQAADMHKAFREKLAKYQQKALAAHQANALAQLRFNTALPGIETLAAGDAALASAIPAASVASNAALRDPAAVRLKGALGRADALRAERAAAVEALAQRATPAAAAEDRAALLSMLEAAAAQPDAAVEALLKDRVAPVVSRVTRSVAEQQPLETELSAAHAAFVKADLSTKSVADRETALQQLATASNAFHALHQQMTQGVAFYATMSDAETALESAVRDYCEARRLQLAELQQHVGGLSPPTAAAQLPAPTAPVAAAPSPLSGSISDSAALGDSVSYPALRL